LALLQAIENASALKAFNGLFLKDYELDYWNGMVAHGMIDIFSKFIHVLLLGPGRTSL
jgi:hypothetical protein